MNEETIFGLLAGLAALYVLIGNFIYLARAVPYLINKGSINGPSFLPSEQFKQLREYAVASHNEGVASLDVKIAKHFSAITGGLFAIAMVLLLALVVI